MRGNPSRRLMTVKANEANMTVNTNATRQCVSFQKCYLTIYFKLWKFDYKEFVDAMSSF